MDSVDTPFTVEDFHISDDVKEWIENKDVTVIIVGPSGVGKTQFCKALAKLKCSKTLVVTNQEHFRRLHNTYDSIIVNDANIHELEHTQFLHLIDNKVHRTLKVTYGEVFKKKGLVQMITMNKKELYKIYYRLKEEKVLWRVLLQHIKRPFLVNLNLYVYIQNNLYNHVYNNRYKQDSRVVDIRQVLDNEQKLIHKNGKLLNELYFSKQE